MNVRRGLLRVWIVLTTLWLVAIGVLLIDYRAPVRYEPKPDVAGESPDYAAEILRGGPEMIAVPIGPKALVGVRLFLQIGLIPPLIAFWAYWVIHWIWRGFRS